MMTGSEFILAIQTSTYTQSFGSGLVALRIVSILYRVVVLCLTVYRITTTTGRILGLSLQPSIIKEILTDASRQYTCEMMVQVFHHIQIYARVKSSQFRKMTRWDVHCLIRNLQINE